MFTDRVRYAMFVLEDGPFVSSLALFPDADTRLNSVRPRPAASSLPAGANLARCLRIRDDNRHSPATLSLLSIPKKAASPREDRLSLTKAGTMNTLIHDASKPFRMRTYAKMRGEGVRT
jgi:hypothetical protein